MGRSKSKQSFKKVTKSQKIVIISLIFILVVGLVTTLGMSGSNKLELTIGKEKVTEEEFLHVMNSEKYDVTRYFYGKYGAEVNQDFWAQEYDGELPYKMLADNVLDSLSLIHATYELAQEKGYLNEIGYDDLLKRFEAENSDREEKIKNGEPVYGLKEFPLDLFLEYEMDALQKKYTNDLENEGMDISQEEGESYYNEKKDMLFVKNDDIEIEYIQIYYDYLELKEGEVNSLEKELKSVHKKLTDEITLESIITDHKSLEPYYQKMKILSEEVSTRAKEIGDVLELSQDIESGEFTQVINQNGSLYLIRCIDRIDYDYLPYEEVKDNVLKILRERNYDQIVAESAEKLQIEADLDKIYKFTKKQLEK